MKPDLLSSALVTALVVESIALVVLIDNQAKLDSIVLSASEYGARLTSLHSLDTVYFRLLFARVGGRLAYLPVSVDGMEYMGLRDRVKQNLTARYDLLDYRQFVTKGDRVIVQISSALRRSFPDDLSYAEAVMDIVHQMFYYSPSQGNWYMKYPVETLVEGSGLCAHLSALAASLMEAGGIDAVLIIYYNPEPGQAGHMNIGVLLDSEPFQGASFTERDGVRYYVAETTNYMFTEEGGFAWDASWRVGQLPAFLTGWQTMTIDI